jgi:hypothetical protein
MESCDAIVRGESCGPASLSTSGVGAGIGAEERSAGRGPGPVGVGGAPPVVTGAGARCPGPAACTVRACVEGAAAKLGGGAGALEDLLGAGSALSSPAATELRAGAPTLGVRAWAAGPAGSSESSTGQEPTQPRIGMRGGASVGPTFRARWAIVAR